MVPQMPQSPLLQGELFVLPKGKAVLVCSICREVQDLAIDALGKFPASGLPKQPFLGCAACFTLLCGLERNTALCNLQ